MTEAPELKLELASDPRCLRGLRDQVGRWAEGHGWSSRQVGEIVLALDEAVTNVIRHAYDEKPNGRIVVCAQMIKDPTEGEGVQIFVRDFGKQVDPACICGRSLDDIRPGGLGVHIIRAMSSSVEYRQAEGGGMLLVLRKFRTHTMDGSGCAGEGG